MDKDIKSWDPFNFVRKMKRDMPDFLEEYTFGEARSPLVDLMNKETEIVVSVELPGVKSEDINLEVQERKLILEAEMSMEYEEESAEEGSYFQERSYSRFSRSIPLPEEVIPEETRAELENGVLEITLAKKNPEKPGSGYKVDIE